MNLIIRKGKLRQFGHFKCEDDSDCIMTEVGVRRGDAQRRHDGIVLRRI